eukprot:TRINITY_DN5194_c0_g1_i2.p1 TRINITY_DN5194_c0_g1~~TRINITY_DN5194_c0_g1_i2.p1  ORF type:complete len:295 (+),score=86.32 TRINITY_DN5194_c0_g1_i2:894-1778(+)
MHNKVDCHTPLILHSHRTNRGELLSFASYARVFPAKFLALVDTYDTLHSGVPNFLSVALALHRLGYAALGIRLDSGDLADLSKRSRAMFKEVGHKVNAPFFERFIIMASDDINEKRLLRLRDEHHEVDCFGIGTHLVTCQAQPALGAVYKLVEITGDPRVKLSEDVGKMSLPGNKTTYRLLGPDRTPLCDLTQFTDEEPPKAGAVLSCYAARSDSPVEVTPAEVECLHSLVWDGVRGVVQCPLAETRHYVLEQSERFAAHTRPQGPAPYPVYLSQRLHDALRVLAAKARGTCLL